jgi:hypothetical protein
MNTSRQIKNGNNLMNVKINIKNGKGTINKEIDTLDMSTERLNLSVSTNIMTNKNENKKKNIRSSSTTPNPSEKEKVYEKLYSLSKIKKVNLQQTEKKEFYKPPKPLNAKVGEKIESMLTRFKESQINTMKKIENLKMKFDEEELSKIKPVPEINEKSKKLINKGDQSLTFHKRLEKTRSNSQKKMQILISEDEKRKEEQNKLNPKLNKKLDKTVIENKIKNLFDWEKEKQQRLYIQQKEKEIKESESCTFKPNILSTSKILASAHKAFVGEKNVSNRLYNNELYIENKHVHHHNVYDSVACCPVHGLIYKTEVTEQNTNNNYKETRNNLEAIPETDNNIITENLIEDIDNNQNNYNNEDNDDSRNNINLADKSINLNQGNEMSTRQSSHKTLLNEI